MNLTNLTHKAYLAAFILSLILVWSPSNALAYVAPILAIGVFIFITKSGTTIRNVIIWFLVWGIIITAYILMTPDFVIHSALLSILTYSSFLMVLVIPRRLVASLDLLDRMLTLARWMVILQALVGITQGLYGFSQSSTFSGANGDFVEGTIHPALASELSLSNPMFAINMTFLLVALLPDLILRRRSYLAVLLGLISLIMASVLHVLLMLAAAGVIATLFYWPLSLRRRMTYYVGIGLMIGAVVAVVALESNFRTAESFARGLLSGESYRSIAVKRAVVDMPQDYPLLPLIGLGPGQFSSRAGLIGTGLYFGRPNEPRTLPLLPTGMSKALEENTLDLWLAFARSDQRGISLGSTHQPFLSWLSVYVEWGILVLLSLFVVVAILLLRVRSVVHNYPQRVLAASFGTGLLFLLFLGVQENYWEVPQAIFVGLLILKVQYAVLMDPETRSMLV